VISCVGTLKNSVLSDCGFEVKKDGEEKKVEGSLCLFAAETRGERLTFWEDPHFLYMAIKNELK